MNRQLIDQFDALKSRQFNANPGSIDGIYLLFDGTAATGVTAALTDLGTVVVKRKGTESHNATIQDFAAVGNINQGSNFFSSAEAGDFIAAVFIPFYEDSFEQALQIRENNELNISYQGTDTSKFDDLTCTAYASLADLPELYLFRMLTQDFSVSAAVRNQPEPLNTENVSSVYIRSSVLTDLQLRVDGKEAISNQSFDMAKAATLFENRLEQDTIDTAELLIHTPGVPATTENENTVLGVTTSGSGDIDVLVGSMLWGWTKNG